MLLSEPILDGEQRDAVEATEPAIAVLAGPGSGKTRVLSYRARHLLGSDPGSRALLMTFTNKAAAEMGARAAGVASVTTDRIVSSTYHAFSARLLRAHGGLLGLTDDFEILDDDEQELIAGEAASAAGTTDRSRRLSYLRLRRYEPQESEVVRFASSYQALKEERNVLDFDDLLVFAAELLEGNSELAQAIGNAHRHILIDEFQDTNPVQFASVRAIWAHATTVSVFADDDQAIYQFAGAEPANIRNFVDELGARVFPLSTNYRCRSEIVNRANRLIAVDETASRRQMRAAYEGGTVRSRVFRDVDAEAEVIGDEIAELLDEGESPSSIAVLGRTRPRLSMITGVLESRGVPVSNWLGAAFEAAERRALTTALYVTRGTLSDRQAERLCELVGVELTDERRPDLMLRAMPATIAGPLGELRELVWTGGSVGDVIDQASVCLIAIDASLAPGLSKIRESVQVFQSFDNTFGTDHLLAELALGSVLGSPTEGGGVKVASLHRAKGLQWNRVYLVGLEQDTLPSYYADTPPELRDERRMCFVGVCRAEEHLELTRVRVLKGWTKDPSPFLKELGFAPT